MISRLATTFLRAFEDFHDVKFKLGNGGGFQNAILISFNLKLSNIYRGLIIGNS